MTKDWDAVQDEIKELSFKQKKPLGEVKELMERKYKFRASTRAYRMKLKEWGLTRHKGRGRKARLDRSGTNNSGNEPEDDEPRARSATAEPMSVDPGSLEHHTKSGGWQVVSSGELTNAQPTFMGMLSQTPNLQPSIEIPTWMQDPPIPSNIVLDMLECILDRECDKLEKLLMEHVNEVNQPIGMPFELPNSRFSNHPALSLMVIMQHPHQTLLDIASAMPNGPVVWVLLSYGARGSIHPLGTDLALHNAIKNGRHFTVQALLVPGRSDVNGIPGKRWRPLLQAVFWTGPEIVSILLKRGPRLDDPGPSPISPGMHTALQLCLERRFREYGDETIRSKCNQNLKLLLHAGASIHVPPPEGSTASPFEKFIEPWQSYDHWNTRLSEAEIDCLGKFVEKGADLSAKFFGCPCAVGSSDTFIHQAIWHSPPRIARQLVRGYHQDAPAGGGLMLHEVVGFCAEAKRHCAEVLEDIETLLSRGVNPDELDSLGKTPLRKCVEQASATDVLALAQKLLDGGADPEHEGPDGLQPYVVAALTLAEPVRSEVVQAMLRAMQGHSTRTKDGRTYKWEAGLFPIPERPTYQQVLSSTKPDDDLQLSMHEMLPIEVQPVFQRAYLAVISGRLLDNITKTVSSNKVNEKNRWDIVLVLSLRKAANLPNYSFDQSLVLALLDFPMIDIAKFDHVAIAAPKKDVVNTARESSPRRTPGDDSTLSITAPAYSPFRLNTNSPSVLNQSQPESRSSHNSDLSNDDFVGDTTQIRWLNPESKRGTTSAANYVIQYKCPNCSDDRRLTKTELQKHEIEHAHTVACDGVGCARRFCKEAQKRNSTEARCQDHLFPRSV
ncbi:hypothetical protein OPT61_g2092 [Boeremia exigua]|uniref:Uncharacterized protein n=1 Tax=Boeremia exigua TaxID=749465 RepID=A0ACC2IMY2_9PLEO|nr:hypothetical protein OPT61_g2092 [Boeremia exigua]